jgi:hypothetical protein
MSSRFRLKSYPLALLVMTALVASSGCSGQTASTALDNSLANAKMVREKVYPLAGQVTVDGQPPQLEKRDSLIVMLNEPGKLDIPSTQKRNMSVRRDGSFAFRTYGSDDGIPPGKYILTFAILRAKGKIGDIGPDKLNNLYNDPDKNSTIPEFVIDHQAPGKSDYRFNLDVAGKEGLTAGPHALTELIDEGVAGANRVKR